MEHQTTQRTEPQQVPNVNKRTNNPLTLDVIKVANEWQKHQYALQYTKLFFICPRQMNVVLLVGPDVIE